MEKATNVYVHTADFGWSDLGTWGSLYEQKEKNEENNVSMGEKIFLYDVKNSLVNINSGKLVVLQGLDDFIVVDTDDVLLVVKKEEEQRIKSFVNDIKSSEGDRYV
jgi:mannose-1-phosphate guanylyltransferase